MSTPQTTSRLQAVQRLITAVPRGDPSLNALTLSAARILNAPIAAIALIDEESVHLLAGVGYGKISREASICAHAILQHGVFEIPDTRADARVREKSLVVEPPYVRFYAGIPLTDAQGYKVGTLCVLDTKPGRLNPDQRTSLTDLGRMVERVLAGWREKPGSGTRSDRGGDEETPTQPEDDIGEQESGLLLTNAAELAGLGYWIWDHEVDRCIYASRGLAAMLGMTRDQYLAELGDPERMFTWFYPEDRDAYRRIWFGKCKQGERYQIDLRVLRGDGSMWDAREIGAPVFDNTGRLVRTVGTFQDITAEKARQREQAQRLREEGALAQLATRAVSEAQPGALTRAIAELVSTTLDADCAVIFRYEQEADGWRVQAATGAFEEGEPSIVAWQDASFPAGALRADRPVVVDDLTNEDRFVRLEPEHRHALRSAAGVPILGLTRPYGILVIYAGQPAAFDEQVGKFLQSIADILASALARIDAERQRQESEGQLTAIADNLPGFIFRRHHAPDGGLLSRFVTHGVADVMGVEPWIAQRDAAALLERVHPEDRDRLAAAIEASGRTQKSLEIEFRAFDRHGELRWLREVGHASGLPDGGVQVDGVVLDITDRKAAETRLDYQARHDALTGLPNRTLVEERLADALIRAQAQGRTVAVAALDIDGFKRVNGAHGREAGDQVLTTIGERLQTVLHERDTVARLGADRFLVLLDGLRGPEDVRRPLAKLRQACTAAMQVAGAELQLTLCVGLTLHPKDGGEAARLLVNAETALASAKRQGPDAYRFYSEELTGETVRFLQVESELRRALVGDELEVFYQPKVALDGYGVTGLEALVRWRHPDRGLLAPGAFLDVAEESGLIVPLSREVLRQACRQMGAWRAAGLGADAHVSVNVSARYLTDGDIGADVEAALAESGLSHTALQLELTETTLMHDLESAREVMAALGERGVAFAIDDFGTGYSSMGYLARLPFSILKIDRSFVMEMIEDPRRAKIVETIVGLARGLDKRVVAEGVETPAHVAALRAIGVDELQGFLFARPMPADQASNLLAGGAISPDED